MPCSPSMAIAWQKPLGLDFVAGALLTKRMRKINCTVEV